MPPFRQPDFHAEAAQIWWTKGGTVLGSDPRNEGERKNFSINCHQKPPSFSNQDLRFEICDSRAQHQYKVSLVAGIWARARKKL